MQMRRASYTHSLMRLTTILLAAISACALTSSVALARPAKTVKKSGPDMTERQLNGLLARYRYVTDGAGQAQVVAQILQCGQPGASALLAEVEKTLRPLLDQYREGFIGTSVKMAAAGNLGRTAAGVAAWQLIIKREDILRKYPAVVAKRRQIVNAGNVQYQCQNALSGPSKGPALIDYSKRLESAENGYILLALYRADTSADGRRQIADEILKLGSGAAEVLLTEVEKELLPLRKEYSRAFTEEAARVARAKERKADGKQVAEWRQAVNGLRSSGLTKENLANQAAPAINHLKETLGVQVNEVAGTAALKPTRERVIGLGDIWTRCGNVVAAARGEPERPGIAEHIRMLEEGAVVASLTTNKAYKAILEHNVVASSNVPACETEAILSLNTFRVILGMNPLAADPLLCDAGRDHSKDMAEKNFFSHESPVPGKTSFTDRAALFGTSAGGENIAGGTVNGTDTVWCWFLSPGHHANMFGNHSRVGVGQHARLWTMMLGS